MRSQRDAELRSLALHRAVAAHVERPGVLGEAQERVERWLTDGSVPRPWAEAWRRLLTGPLDELCARLEEDSEEMIDLRQCSPFADALSPRERWQVLVDSRSDEAR